MRDFVSNDMLQCVKGEVEIVLENNSVLLCDEIAIDCDEAVCVIGKRIFAVICQATSKSIHRLISIEIMVVSDDLDIASCGCLAFLHDLVKPVQLFFCQSGRLVPAIQVCRDLLHRALLSVVQNAENEISEGNLLSYSRAKKIFMGSLISKLSIIF